MLTPCDTTPRNPSTSCGCSVQAQDLPPDGSSAPPDEEVEDANECSEGEDVLELQVAGSVINGSLPRAVVGDAAKKIADVSQTESCKSPWDSCKVISILHLGLRSAKDSRKSAALDPSGATKRDEKSLLSVVVSSPEATIIARKAV